MDEAFACTAGSIQKPRRPKAFCGPSAICSAPSELDRLNAPWRSGEVDTGSRKRVEPGRLTAGPALHLCSGPDGAALRGMPARWRSPTKRWTAMPLASDRVIAVESYRMPVAQGPAAAAGQCGQHGWCQNAAVCFP